MKIDEITQRPNSYLIETGMPWLASGSIFTVLGISSLIWPPLARAHPYAAMAVQWAGVAWACLVLFGVWKLKRWFVFPRVGYAAPRNSRAVRVIRILSFGFIPLAWIFARGGHRMPEISPRFTAPAFCVVFALIAAWPGRKSRVGYGFAVYLICLGAVLWWTQTDGLAGMSWLEIGIGAPLAIYGAIRLGQFMRANPEPVGEAE